jgi:hypothetical protein
MEKRGKKRGKLSPFHFRFTTSGDVISGDATSGDATSGITVSLDFCAPDKLPVEYMLCG